MKVTYNWLKDFVDIKIPPRALADKLTMAGLEVTSLEEKDGDFVFEIEITSNRPDWLGVLGIAREIAAITGKKLKIPKESACPPVVTSGHYFSIEIEDKKDCPLYTAKIICDVKVDKSPDWLKKRLELIGCRSVNNIVDITNYVLFESGQPLHAFDLDKLTPGRIVVRRAAKGEKITTIDAQEKILDPGILVISDKEKAVAIAGVMGGKDTEVSQSTRNILLEAAVFNPIVVRSGRQRLGLQSDSSYRFERGVNKEIVASTSMRAARLIQEVAGGKCVLAISSRDSKVKIKPVILKTQNVNRILGLNLTASKINKILKSLDFKTRVKTKTSLMIQAPSHRADINLEIDLIEEIARIYGYESIPKTLPKITPRANFCGKRDLVSLTKNILVGLGLNEAITYSLIDRERLSSFAIQESRKAVEIMNPLSKEQEVLRTAIAPSLASCVAFNLNQKQEYVNLFEISGIFLETQTAPKEELTLSVCLCGTKSLLLEQGLIKEEAGFLHLKGIIEALFERLGIVVYDFESRGNLSAILISAGQEEIGTMAKLQKGVLERLGIKNKDLYTAELCLDKVFSLAQLKKKFVPAPKYPGIARDISFILKEEVSVKNILLSIEGKGRPLLRAAKITDYYKGKQIPAGHRGLTISCFYRSDERTLTETEVAPLHASICAVLTEEFAVKIR